MSDAVIIPVDFFLYLWWAHFSFKGVSGLEGIHGQFRCLSCGAMTGYNWFAGGPGKVGPEGGPEGILSVAQRGPEGGPQQSLSPPNR